MLSPPANGATAAPAGSANPACVIKHNVPAVADAAINCRRLRRDSVSICLLLLRLSGDVHPTSRSVFGPMAAERLLYARAEGISVGMIGGHVIE
jgi:hypothetical protein